jgi:hypothetical protein
MERREAPVLYHATDVKEPTSRSLLIVRDKYKASVPATRE